MSANLAQRLLVASVAIPLITVLIFWGGIVYFYFVLLLAAIAIFEYLHNFGLHPLSSLFLIPYLGTIACVYFGARGEVELSIFAVLTVFVLVGIVGALGKTSTAQQFYAVVYVCWGLIYIGGLYPFVYLLRGDATVLKFAENGWWMFFLLTSLWLCDTAAMAFGLYLGRFKLAPLVSPNKTVEGFIGGYVGALVIALVFKFFILQQYGLRHFLLLALLIATFGQLGDLLESLWKRSLAIKDSSSLISGHGGVLDRFDSLLYTAPIVYLYLIYIMQIK